MSARDLIHNDVRKALTKDGWKITHDPFAIRLGIIRVKADLGAERLIAATKENQKIAVEIKSFTKPSLMEALEVAIGQYNLYAALLLEVEPERKVYLAISDAVYFRLFDTREGKIIIERLGLRIVVIKIETQEVVQWVE